MLLNMSFIVMGSVIISISDFRMSVISIRFLELIFGSNSVVSMCI